jgi:hypothetical protein
VTPTDPETSIPPVEEEQPSTEEVTGTTS